jgi:hypothetical protein
MTKETLYTSGKTGKILEPVAGKKLEYPCNERLRQELPNAFQRALRSSRYRLKY